MALPVVELPDQWSTDDAPQVTLTGTVVGDYRGQGYCVVLLENGAKVKCEIASTERGTDERRDTGDDSTESEP